MPEFWFVKDEKGKSKIVSAQKTKEIEVSEVVVAPATKLAGRPKNIKCNGCGKTFGSTGVFVIHYNKNHIQEATNREEWRSGFTEV